ncbi:MAG: site-specific integrase [Pseudomonadota bacterium]
MNQALLGYMAQKARTKSSAKNAAKTAPAPILDSLETIGDPHRQAAFPVDHHFSGAVVDGASADYEAVVKFLFSYNGSPSTVSAYRRELERLLQWSWRVRRNSILALKREDIEDYIRFSIDPPAAWIGVKNVARFVTHDGDRIPNPDWRPFVISAKSTQKNAGKAHYTPSQASIRLAFAVLSSFYDYLCQETIVSVNPVALIRQKSKFLRKDHDLAPVRRISNLQWDYVIETAELLAEKDPDQHERTLFIMNCLLGMYLRISELVADARSTPVMSDFRKDQDGRWWFHVTGKGNKNRTVTVSDQMLEALKRYRAFRRLPPLPTIDEQAPLVSKLKGAGAVSSTRQIRRIVQICFDESYERMKRDGLANDAQELRTATVHWLRHTGISEDVKVRPREHVRDDAGHASMVTTDRYIESDRRERHSSGKGKLLKDL